MAVNSEPHRIRLAGPWLEQATNGSVQKTKLPFQTREGSQPLTVIRSFNGSAGMLSADRVCLQISFQGPPPVVQLNQQTMEESEQPPADNVLQLEITKWLQRSNSLQLTCETQADNLITDVYLLIYEPT